MTQYKLKYFDVRAVGEVIRYIFAYAGVEYEDIRIDLKDRNSYKTDAPFGQMPILYVDDKKIPQSAAISRFLAKKYGLAGENDFEAAWVDAIVDQYKDYYNVFKLFYQTLVGLSDADKDTALVEYGVTARDSFFPAITKILEENKSGFLVGKSVTFADFLLAEHVSTMHESLYPGFLDDYPQVVAHSKKIREIPQIKEWIKKRPMTKF